MPTVLQSFYVNFLFRETHKIDRFLRRLIFMQIFRQYYDINVHVICTVSPLKIRYRYVGNRTKPLSGQNPPPTKPPPPSGKKKLSGQNPPSTKIPFWPKPPSDKTPLRQKKKNTILSTPSSPPPLLHLLSNEYYESYKPTTLINCKLPNLLLLYR